MRELNSQEIEIVNGAAVDPGPLVPNPQSDMGRVINDVYSGLYNGFTKMYEGLGGLGVPGFSVGGWGGGGWGGGNPCAR